MITIGIVTWNEKNTLRDILERVINEDYHDDVKIIIVAGGNSIPVAEEYSLKNKDIFHIKELQRAGKPSALNLILDMASGDYIIFIDGDVYLQKGFIKGLINKFDNGVGIVTSQPVTMNSKNTMIGFWQHFLLSIAHEQRLKNEFKFASGSLFALRKGIIKSIRTDALADDALISRIVFENGYKIVYNSDVKVGVKFPTKLKDWISQKRRCIVGHHQINMWKGKQKESRGFSGEAKGIKKAFEYCSNLKEYIWMMTLIPFRALVWALSFWDFFSNKSFFEIWKHVESAK